MKKKQTFVKYKGLLQKTILIPVIILQFFPKTINCQAELLILKTKSYKLNLKIIYKYTKIKMSVESYLIKFCNLVVLFFVAAKIKMVSLVLVLNLKFKEIFNQLFSKMKNFIRHSLYQVLDIIVRLSLKVEKFLCVGHLFMENLEFLI